MRLTAQIAAAVALGGLVVGLLVGVVRAPEGQAGGAITVEVPGAMTVAVFCERGKTFHTTGEVASFVPAGRQCDIEAPLSPVMPLRGQFEVTGPGAYTCARVNMDLDCRKAP